MSAVPSVAVEKELEPSFQEQNFVHNVYNDIAPHFSQTRYKPWPVVEEFLKTREKHSIGLDVGCGNGKYLAVNRDIFTIGTDRSEGLINCGRDLDTDYNLGVADGLSLPHPSGRFDYAISIAVIHHFANEERRIEAIRHILSKLRDGGQLLVYCWALEQEKLRRGYKEGDEQDILIPWVKQQKQPKQPKVNKKRMSPEERAQYEKEEQERREKIEQEKKEATRYRYYHLYRNGELQDNAVRAGGKVVKEGYEKDNWWVIIEK